MQHSAAKSFEDELVRMQEYCLSAPYATLNTAKLDGQRDGQDRPLHAASTRTAASTTRYPQDSRSLSYNYWRGYHVPEAVRRAPRLISCWFVQLLSSPSSIILSDDPETTATQTNISNLII